MFIDLNEMSLQLLFFLFIAKDQDLVTVPVGKTEWGGGMFVTQMVIKVNILSGTTFLLHYVSWPIALGNFLDQFRSAD